MDNNRNYIEFILDNAIKRVYFDTGKGITPTTTLLQFLRNNENHKGTKEGCGEGDCGACTVVLAEDNHGKIIYKACNSCLILLPQIHGKQVITVENLNNGQQLHPVQLSMVEMDASQCGFCTPGFVMSLFALTKNLPNATDAQIQDAFAGNLCRCTGYESILKAARLALKQNRPDAFALSEKQLVSQLASIKKQTGYFETSAQTYFQPIGLNTALSWINKYPHYEKVSGSTDVALRVTKKKEAIPAIIDLSEIAELKNIDELEDAFFIGSQISLQTIKEVVGEKIPSINKILSLFGSKQIRHLATLGGNIASASPIGDMLPLLMALNAKVELKSVDNERLVAVDDFIMGYRKTCLKANEVITQIIIPKPQKVFIDIEKVSKRIDLDISSVSVALRLKLSERQTIDEIKLIYGGMAAFTQRATHVESFLLYKTWSEENLKKAAYELEKDFNPISDARATTGGRMQLAKNLLLKLWLNSNKNQV